MWGLWNWNPYAFQCGKELYVERRPKRKPRGGWPTAKGYYSPAIRPNCTLWSGARGYEERVLCGGLFCGSAKIARARLAGTNFAEMLEAENSRRVTIGKLNLQRVIPHRVGALGGDARLVHRQQRRAGAGAALSLLLTLVVAQRARAMIAQVREIVAAGVHVRPRDLDALACRDVYLDAQRFFSRVLCDWHLKISLRFGKLPSWLR